MSAASRLIRSEYVVLALCGVLFAALAPFTPGLAAPENARNLLGSLSPLLVVALGQTIVLIAGGIDLSVTSIIALTSIAGASVMNSENGWLKNHPLAMPVGVGVMLLLGALVGAGNGFAVTKFRMPAFIVTLTTMMFFSGLAIWITKSKNIAGLPSAFTSLGNGLWIALAIASSLALLAHVLLSQSLFGRWLYAVGHNPRTAHVSGVPVDGVVIAAYVVSGFLAAAASVLYTARLETASPVLGQRILLDVIGATVIGGTSLFGGKGKVAWTICGVLFLTLLDNALNLRGLSHFSIMMVKGCVILFAALLDAMRNRFVVRAS
ncbi:MAG TPA: ABC transporter permease [Verrucomicrobiae bacterium]|jgi:ribose/xylose/arabinose/galactoside ABC-type transport system permease subunit